MVVVVGNGVVSGIACCSGVVEIGVEDGKDALSVTRFCGSGVCESTGGVELLVGVVVTTGCITTSSS